MIEEKYNEMFHKIMQSGSGSINPQILKDILKEYGIESNPYRKVDMDEKIQALQERKGGGDHGLNHQYWVRAVLKDEEDSRDCDQFKTRIRDLIQANDALIERQDRTTRRLRVVFDELENKELGSMSICDAKAWILEGRE